MTNDKAIKLLHRIADEQFDGIHGDERREALEMAVRALSGEGDTIYRQDAIDAVAKWFYDVFGIKESDGTATIFKRLRELPSAQSETHDKRTETHACDCISRQAAIDALDGFRCGTKAAWKVIEDLPSAQTEPSQVARDICTILENEQDMRVILKNAQPERKKGKWIKLDMHAHITDHKCTACGGECYVPTCMGEPMYAYCPNCGADMRGESDE